MNQDRGQKSAALRYAVSKRWFPQLELDVSTYMTTSQTAKFITDIDVFAAVPDEFVGFRGVAFDCKTKKGESPISRALWQRGLLERVRADRGICILRTPRIETDHRYTAAQLGVTLLTESEFDVYATATAHDYKSVSASIIDIDRWDTYFAIGERFPKLEPAIRFSRSGYWMSDGEAEACVRTLFLLNQIRGELDPSRAEHLAVVMDTLSLFLHSMARLVVRIFGEYLQPAQRETLSTALLHFLYGGRGTYNHLNRIRRMLAGAPAAPSPVAAELAPIAVEPARGDTRSEGMRTSTDDASAPTKGASRRTDKSPRELSLPEWDRFVELTRQMLDAPLEVAHAPLLARELGWASLGAGVGPTDGVSDFAKSLAVRSPQGARFAVLGLDYLCRATKLPREFGEILSNRLLLAQAKR